MDDIAKRIAALRARDGLSQTEAAERLGMAQPSLAQIETGVTKTLRGKTVAMLCRVYRTTAEFIVFGGEDSQNEELASLEAELLHMVRLLGPDQRKSALDSIRGIFNGQVSPEPVKPASARKRIVDRLPKNLGAPLQETFDDFGKDRATGTEEKGK